MCTPDYIFAVIIPKGFSELIHNASSAYVVGTAVRDEHMVQVTQTDWTAVLIDQLVLIVDGIVVNLKNASRIKNS